MNTATDIDAIAINADETLEALRRYRSEGAGVAFSQYRDTVGDIANGKSVDPQTLSRILQFAGKSDDNFREDFDRAMVIAKANAAEIEARQIEAACRPILAELKRLESEFLAVQKTYRQKSEELNFAIDRLEAPLKNHSAIKQQLRSAEADRPASLRTDWGDQTAALTKERLRIMHPIDQPSGPEVTAGKIQAWETEERRRKDRLESIDTWLAVYRRAEEIVRDTYLDKRTGIWDPLGNPSQCLDLAHKEIMDAKAAKRRAAIEEEQVKQAAEDSEPDNDNESPGRISTLAGSLQETVA